MNKALEPNPDEGQVFNEEVIPQRGYKSKNKREAVLAPFPLKSN
jgi:hypothetical protein